MDKVVGDDFALGVAGFSFSDLHDPLRLRELHDTFWEFASHHDPLLRDRFAALDDESTPRPQQSDVLMEVASQLGDFLAELFQIVPDAIRLRDETLTLEAIFQFKQDFLKARIFKRFGEPASDDSAFIELNAAVQQLISEVPQQSDTELQFAQTVLALLAAEKQPSPEQQAQVERITSRVPGKTLSAQVQQALTRLGDWCVQVNADASRRHLIQGWI